MPFRGFVSADLMSSATPSRLLCRRGRWALEMTRLIAIDSHILQPRSQRVEGNEAILMQLKRSVDANLAQSAAQLMRSLRGDEERSFDLVDGEWVPAGGTSSQTSEEAVVERTGLLESALTELRAEVLMLRASHQRLKRRVETLEARAENFEVAPRKAVEKAALTPARFASARPPDSEPRIPVAPAIPQHTPDVNGTLASGRPSEPGEQRAMGAVVAQRNESAHLGANLTPSSPAEVVSTLTELFGGDPEYALTNEPLPESALELVALYACQLLDDDGNAVGAVLSDIRATANLGGRLAGVPNSLIEEQAKTGLLNDTVTAAMSEVCNTLTTMLGRVPGNSNLRSSPLESFPVDRLGWVRDAKNCLAFTKPRGGTFWVVTR